MHWKEKTAALSLPDDEYVIAIGESLLLVPRLMGEATAEMRALADRLDREQTGGAAAAAVNELNRIADALDETTAKSVAHDSAIAAGGTSSKPADPVA
ncbi:hypothetical protein A5666_00025 [Mycolicibacterium fortuitum]|uniref:hypothetical protein n=1 Tax=Mycolicibacterium fortuitum TaxID=1766 RepID=UPI0007EBC006|nr:hypothetical protein [Mycolicibacterium fortuitum]OBA92965.1 hypothetical protein A5665_10665 [Mycolicibacterium fortuitum]OBI66914.1 hypothetical protein A5666_00025 [Mycolicibacterium fortuitum]